MICNIFVTFL